ncbi:MAG TPA: SMR family transporter [Bacteroidia bacterium]|jgi:quaternary ammonium compound-resistance protein SugE|nr:SMR family transporter [Bacteroidia bacterium]
MAWLFLFIASCCEICWIYSLKFFSWKKLSLFSFSNLFTLDNLALLLPGLGYILFGVGNIICFSKAMKSIPASVAFAAWMAVALIGVKIVDVAILKEPLSIPQIVFMLLILIGIVGLKVYQ